MGGVYGEIDSRADFDRVLKEARFITRRMLKVQMDPTIENIDTQLDALERWTANGGVPTEIDRRTISVGVIAARNLDDVRDPEIQVLCDKLHALQNYVTEWPSDDDAASATDADYWARFGL
jgi:hypothetical protein